MKINIVKNLPKNTLGRDFVVGDLHGSISLINELLSRVDFDTTKDRLLLVGDLADRGPESRACLALLLEPWCHSVMGNHEELLLGGFWSTIHPGIARPNFFYGSEEDLLFNGGQWTMDEFPRPSDEFFHLLEKVAELPQIIVVGEGDGRFNIVHAELPLSYTDETIDSLPTVIDIDEFDSPYFRWARVIMDGCPTDHAEKKTRDGLSDTYTGHTIGKGIRQADGHICLDTGAFKSYKDNRFCLTMIEPATGIVTTSRPYAESQASDSPSM